MALKRDIKSITSTLEEVQGEYRLASVTWDRRESELLSSIKTQSNRLVILWVVISWVRDPPK